MQTLSFEETHNYPQSSIGIEVPITLSVIRGPSVRVLAKIDTGASFCIFARGYAEGLGLEVESGDRMEFATATGFFVAFGHSMELECFKWRFQTTVYFAEESGFNRNVLGRNGWLNHFRMGLIDHDGLSILSRYDD